MNLPSLPDPEALCERPDCDHAQADHARLLGMRCTVSWCSCGRFAGPGIDTLMAQLAAYYEEHSSMKTYTVILTNGTSETVVAERYEQSMGAITFYDEDGEEVITYASGSWTKVEP